MLCESDKNGNCYGANTYMDKCMKYEIKTEKCVLWIKINDDHDVGVLGAATMIIPIALFFYRNLLIT